MTMQTIHKNTKNTPRHDDFKYHAYASTDQNQVGFLFSNGDSSFHMHDDFAEFSLITSGEWEHVYDGVTTQLEKNTLIYLGAGTQHALIACSQECSHFTFFFKEEYLKKIIANCFPDNENILTARYQKVILAPSVSTFLLHESHKMASNRSSENRDLEFQNYIHNLLYFMFFNDNVSSEPTKKNAYASRLRTFLDNYLYLDEPMKALYNMFPVSPATLIKHFEIETGQTIVQYRNDKRMEYASLLLRDHKITVAAVANQVGISNPSHFAAEFKKKFGISPKEFAKRHSTPQ